MNRGNNNKIGSDNQEIIPRFYYDQLHEIGKDALCDGKYVEGLGYVIPEIVVTARKPNNYETFYDLNIDLNVMVAAPPGPKIVPLFIMEREYKDVYRHHVNAIQKRGKPTILTYDSSVINARKRRNLATDPYFTLTPVFERDEYPYGTTMEGGLGASVEYVLLSNNRKHGKYISTIRSAFEMQTGDKFEILLVPDIHKEYELKRQPIPENVPEPILKPGYQNRYEPIPAPVYVPSPAPSPVPEVGKWGAILAAMSIFMKSIDVAVSRVFLIVIPPSPMDFTGQDFDERYPGES